MADKVIEDLTAVSSANLTDVLPVVQGTSPAKKATLTQIRTAMALGAIYQPLDATLTALAALDSSAGFVKQTAADTFSKVTPAVTDLAALTVSRALVSDGSGIISAATTTSTEIGYVNGVTSAIQTQLDAKAPLASPTFTGTVTVPTPFTIGAVSVTATGTELNYVAGVTSAIQTQLNDKQASLGFTPEDSANKNASGGYAGLTAGKITASQMQEVLAVTDLTTYSGVSGSGSTAIAATFTSLTTNDVLTWSGTNWINQAPSGGALTYPLLADDSYSVSTPSYARSGDANTGVGFPAADTLALIVAGAEVARATAGVFDLGAGAIKYGSAIGTSTVGVAYASAGVLKVTDGSSGYGAIDTGTARIGGQVNLTSNSSNAVTFQGVAVGNTTLELREAGGGSANFKYADSSGNATFYLSTTGATNDFNLLNGSAVLVAKLKGDGSGLLLGSGSDVGVARSAAGVLKVTDGSSGYGALQALAVSANTANGAGLNIRTISESITLNTGGTTTDSSAYLLPANSFILFVTARITTGIGTATDWKLGDSVTAARFTSANSTLTAGTTDIGGNHLQGSVSTDAAGPLQIAAAKLRITTTGTPSAGVIRVTTTYVDATAPTS